MCKLHIIKRYLKLVYNFAISQICSNICHCLFQDVGSIVNHAMMTSKDMMEINLLGSGLPEMTWKQLENYAGKSVGIRRFINFVNMMRVRTKALENTERHCISPTFYNYRL